MTDEPNEAARQRYLDEHYPFIDQNAPPPGGWVEGLGSGKVQVVSGGKHWQGLRGWRTRHGQAAVTWSLGRPEGVALALYPDGSRGEVRDMLDHGFRRRSEGPKLWVYGAIDIKPDDVVFTDGVQPNYEAPLQSGSANLEADLARDQEFRAALQDRKFAEAVYNVAMNRTFLKGTDRWTCGDRQAARLVANLRGLGESYQDYFLHYRMDGVWPDDRAEREAELKRMIQHLSAALKDQPPVSPQLPEQGKAAAREHSAKREFAEYERVYEDLLKQIPALEAQLDRLNEKSELFDALRSHLTRLSWRTENAKDREENQKKQSAARTASRIAALGTIRDCEARPAGDPDRVAVRQATGMVTGVIRVAEPSPANLTVDEREAREPGGLERRVAALAKSGRISQQEYDDLMVRIIDGSYYRPVSTE